MHHVKMWDMMCLIVSKVYFVVCFLLGNSLASEFYICQHFGTLCLFDLRGQVGVKNEQVEKLRGIHTGKSMA